jgi:flagellar biosynthesis/type III secretory pathway chaperone
MTNTYVDIMIQSLNKKIRVLEEIEKLNLIQKALLEDEKSDADEFDQIVEQKAVLIEQMSQLDSGFDKLFQRVKEEVTTKRSTYSEDIKMMQDCIRRITDLSMELQKQEARNKELMMKKFTFIREKAKVVRTNKKAVNQYYKNMMNLHYVDPQFMDNKK